MKVARQAGVAARALVLVLLRFYRAAVSPSLGQNCRYHPSCSAYAEEAVAVHGAFRGSGLALWRLLRCHPWCHGGIDRVPPALPSKQVRA